MKILSVVSMALLSIASFADDVVPVDKVKNSINVRQNPNATAEIVGRLKQGASLPLVRAVDGWYEVQLDADMTGFVSADWARVVDLTADDMTVVESTADVVDDTGAETPAAEAETAAEMTERTADVVAAAAETETVEEIEETEEIMDASIEKPDAAAMEQKEDVELEIAEQAPALGQTQAVTGPAGPSGPPGAANIKGTKDFLVKFRKETEGGNSQIYDDGNQVGIGTTEPKQRLEVNGSIQIHEQNSTVAGLMITQSAGDTGYIMHNRAGTLTIGAGSQDRITIDRDGNVGIGISKPVHPLEMSSGAHVTAGGVWTNSSSRDKKENIAALSDERALAALSNLEPVLFNYRNERHEEYVGFIAEDVPDLVASQDRQTLSAMDIVAVLTKVVQAQQQRIEELEARMDTAGQRP